ncbi:Os02g0502900 [Oryza sativa Japonica Group]|uniref:Os02g0502900 protein n=1 Tax=Oryza sativa subsp. japonica TaxID=39947 RepID=A0A0P0VJ98_ORYSJ|nr:Os02g0502900 [Oryza sativa Japonica Group]
MIPARNSGYRGTILTTAATTTNFTASAEKGTPGRAEEQLRRSDGERKGGRDVGWGEEGNEGPQQLPAMAGGTERKRERRKKARKKKRVVAGTASAVASDRGGGRTPNSPTRSRLMPRCHAGTGNPPPTLRRPHGRA